MPIYGLNTYYDEGYRGRPPVCTIAPRPPHKTPSLSAPHALRPLKWEDIAQNDFLIGVGVDIYGNLSIKHDSLFLIISDPVMHQDIGYRVRMRSLAQLLTESQIYLCDYGIDPLEPPRSLHRTFPWNEENEAYLRELAQCQAYNEYVALISPKPASTPRHLVSASSSRDAHEGNSEHIPATPARKRIGNSRTLRERFIMDGVRRRIRAKLAEDCTENSQEKDEQK